MPAFVGDVTALEALLRELVVEVRGLRSDLGRDRKARFSATLSRADCAVLSRLLPAIGGALGSEPFLARDLFDHESAALRLVLSGLNAKRIGRLFQRGDGQAIDGYLVERAGDELHTTLWRVVEVLGSPLPAVPPPAPGGQA